MTEKDKMLQGELYQSNDETLSKMRHQCQHLIQLFNRTTYDSEKQGLIRQLFGDVGKNVMIHAPFYCDYGQHIHVGDDFFANYDCIILDVNHVTIGNRVMFGPRVCIYTAGHPLDHNLRKEGYEFGYPVTIGDDVWIGGNVVINPGVTIGSRTVIGSGSVVTKDIPSDVVAAGNPCKVIRKNKND